MLCRPWPKGAQPPNPRASSNGTGWQCRIPRAMGLRDQTRGRLLSYRTVNRPSSPPPRPLVGYRSGAAGAATRGEGGRPRPFSHWGSRQRDHPKPRRCNLRAPSGRRKADVDGTRTPRATFHRAIDRGNLLVAEMTAREIGRITLAEALEHRFVERRAASDVRRHRR
jgi:hypothetical protein